MHVSPKDIVLYMIFGLTVAVGVNHFAKLNIPFLNTIERAMIPPSERGYEGEKKYFDYTNSPGASAGLKPDCKRLKTSGDAKILLRDQIRQAKAKKDTYKLRELEDRLRQIENNEREACR